MKNILKNIFDPDKPTTRYCTVVEQVFPARYKVEDVTGRVVYAESKEFYPPGVSVIVQDGKITGRGQLTGKHRVYEV